jgi:hypothetical protein
LPAENESTNAAIAKAISDVSEKAQVIIREEIELAKVEMTTKAMSLLRGAVIGAAAGIFVIVGLLFALHGLAWLAWYEIFPGNTFFWGFFVVAAVLFLMGGLAGFLAARLFKKGTPPTPKLAIEEAQKIKTTINAPEAEKTY